MSDLSQVQNVSDLLNYNKGVQEPEDRVESTLKVVYELGIVEAKAVLLDVLETFHDYHQNVSTRLFEEGDTEAAIGWSKDAGKLQSAYHTINSVEV